MFFESIKGGAEILVKPCFCFRYILWLFRLSRFRLFRFHLAGGGGGRRRRGGFFFLDEIVISSVLE